MNRWPQVDVAKGIAIVMLAAGIATLWLVSDPHFEGFNGTYRAAAPLRFWSRLATSVTPPTFFLLSGAVIGKRFADLQDPAAASAWAQHLLARGIFLVMLELGITQLYNLSHPGSDYVLIFEVLSAFGWSFIAIAIAHRAPPWLLGVAAGALWLTPELLSSAGPIHPDDSPAGFVVAAAMFVADHPPWQVEYPLASWLPFILIGVLLGRRWALHGGPPPVGRLARGAVIAIACFVVLRSVTTFGTLGQQSPGSLQQFLSPTKYPVSLQFAIMGLAGAALTLALATALCRRGGRVVDALQTLGKQPLLAFVLVKILVAGAQVIFDVRGRNGTLTGALVTATAIVVVLVPTLAAYDRLKRRARGRWVLFRLL